MTKKQQELFESIMEEVAREWEQSERIGLLPEYRNYTKEVFDDQRRQRHV